MAIFGYDFGQSCVVFRFGVCRFLRVNQVIPGSAPIRLATSYDAKIYCMQM